jgi:hypothetical protein
METPVLQPAPSLEQPSSDDTNRCAGSDDNLGRVDIVPDSVLSGAGGSASRIQYHAEIKVAKASAGIAWTVDVVDDRGRVVQTNLTSGSTSGSAGQITETQGFSPTLADGYYALNVRAAMVTHDQAADIVESRQFIRVQNGAWTELDETEWRYYSRAIYAYNGGRR